MSKLHILDAKIALLTGGWSDEKEISQASGEACYKALKQAGFSHVDYLEVSNDTFFEDLQAGNYDVAFIAMHGKYGEDGCIQGMLEILRIPYTFSGVLASSLASDKHMAKLAYSNASIPVPLGMELAGVEQLTEDMIAYLEKNLDYPMFVKPASNGSSYGVTRVTSAQQLPAAVELACSHDDHALVEQAIQGIEITVPVVGNQNPKALPIIEINTGSDFYDSQVKYEPAELHHVIPARLPEDVYKQAQAYACAAHQALGCSGASRSDFIVTTDGTPVILETNTIPGMTENSLLPDSSRFDGVEFDELCYTFIKLALQRFNIDFIDKR